MSEDRPIYQTNNNIEKRTERFLLVAPSGKIIIYPTIEDERQYPGSFIINTIMIDFYVEQKANEVPRDFIDTVLDYENLPEKELIKSLVNLEIQRRQKSIQFNVGCM